jgi:Uma2 family endonuclease
MATVKSPTRLYMTKDEFLKLPEGPPYYEYDHGVVTPLHEGEGESDMALPSGRHQKVIGRLWAALDQHITAQQLGEVWMSIDVWLVEERSIGPDIVYLSSDHQSLYSEEDGDIHGVPDLMVEVLSPNSINRDRFRKFNEYQAAGVPWYWIVDPALLIIEEYQITPDGYLRTGGAAAGEVFRPRLFPELEINLRTLMGGAS